MLNYRQNMMASTKTRKQARRDRMEAMKGAICAMACEHSLKLEGTMTAWVYLVVPPNGRSTYYVTRNSRCHIQSLDTDPEASLKAVEGFRGGKSIWKCLGSPLKLEEPF
jgi:hypothetical protein